MLDRIVAVVVTYNKPELLQNCLNSIYQQSHPCVDVVLIDNGGFQDTQKVVSRFNNKGFKIHHHIMNENLGGAGGFYQGIKDSFKYAPDFVWILDDDTIPENTALEQLIEAKNSLNDMGVNEVGLLASNVLWKDNSKAIMNVPKFSTDDKKVNGLLPIISSSFVSMLVSSDAIKSLGLPIKEFFIWGDDAEFSRRISTRYSAYWVQKSKVIHMMATNSGPNIITEKDTDRLDRYFYEFRNRIYILRKYENNYMVLKKVLKNMSIAVVALFQKDGVKRFKIVLNGTVSGFSFNPKVVKL
ncbi:glycosyltransferase [Lapidilactobacillus bayanensis]|uniref:glycosyltransferase n=1 Tax=Lapidilactobacillus bayanensis TaxID=2485998 RepID=UPI0013DE52AF|nr:glycosyltransferase [Lapidilactobacillus bayanensis]